MFFNPLCLGQYKNEKVQMDSPKKKAVGEKIVVDAEDLLSIARDLESSSNIVHINGKEWGRASHWMHICHQHPIPILIQSPTDVFG